MKATTIRFIKSNKKIIKLKFEEITIIKSIGNYVEIFTDGEKKYVYYRSLKDLINVLPDEFMRIHNSFIVNLMNIDFLDENHVILKGTKIAVGKTYKKCLANTIEHYLL